ncbi:hypothetical protein CDL12_11810 [Handroanthus impetiginosus]|uniref:BHLH domain-containing protein n=1 Tax=Handroanthus impetiginosus TaxID=429701 RepID=A0A2G9HDF2_9LAMI|nr:hypothetical protein CDL12_11810 [Handroanthus impetiginosus]
MAPFELSSLELLLKQRCDFSNPLCRNRVSMKNTKCRRRMLMKRRARSDRSNIRARNAIERKVRILKKLINPKGEFMGVERLFMETADYIVALQMRVKVMQIMVNVLAGSE